MTKQHVRHPAFEREHCSYDASASGEAPHAPSQTSFSSNDGTLTPDSQQSELIRMADAMSVISVGSLAQVGLGAQNLPDKPILQCVQIKPMASQNGNERYRVVMNDTVNFIQGMLAQRESAGVHSRCRRATDWDAQRRTT